MSELEETAEPVDGRVARRQRNVDAVLDVVLEMFAEDAMFPSMEQVASRSGLSLRSLYRYFADPGELRQAAISRNNDVASRLSHLHAIGAGPLDRRIEAFVAMRVRLHDAVAPVLRATVANAFRQPEVGEERRRNRDALRAQFELQFAPELDSLTPERRTSVVAAGDVLTQLDSIEFLRSQRNLSAADATVVLAEGLAALLAR